MSNYSDLPVEIIHCIAQYLPEEALRALSSCSQRDRATLERYVFRKLCFTNREESLDRALLQVDQYKQYIKHLDIEFSLQIQADGLDVDGPALINGEPSKKDLPPAAMCLLRGDYTPYVTELTLEFKIDKLTKEDRDSLFEKEESGIQIQDQESKRAHLALMGQVWTLLSSNQKLRSLMLPSMIAREMSILSTKTCGDFFGQLYDLDVCILGPDEGDFFTYDGFYDFLKSMDSLIFRHARHLRTLRLVGAFDAFFGYSSDVVTIDYPKVPIPLPLQASMPSLHSLELENCVVCRELLDFISINKSSLLFFSLQGFAQREFDWSQFFNGLAKLQPKFKIDVLCDRTRESEFEFYYLSYDNARWLFMDLSLGREKARSDCDAYNRLLNALTQREYDRDTYLCD